MMKYVVCGSSVEDVQNGVEAMKLAIASGARCGVGGDSIAEVEQAVSKMREMLHPSCDCPCPHCGCEVIAGGDAIICECEDEDIGYSEGYMAMNECGEELSFLCDSPEEAMVEAIEEGYDLDDIGIYEVRAYDDNSVEVVNTIHRPTK